MARSVIKHSILRGKDLLVQDVGDVVKVTAPVKHVLAVCVHVPVKYVCRCMVPHVAVGDEAHVGVLGSDCCEEGDVVLHVPGLPTVLQMHPAVTCIQAAQQAVETCSLCDYTTGVLGSDGCEEGYVVLLIPGLPTVLQMHPAKM